MADVLRDDGVSYGDYLEQITYLIFLKMCHEYPPRIFKGNSIRFYLPDGKRIRLTLFLLAGARDFVRRLGLKTKLDLKSFT